LGAVAVGLAMAIWLSLSISRGLQRAVAAASRVAEGDLKQDVAASMEEMAANVKQNAENASQTETIARQSAKDAEASGAAVGRAV
ncbi:HAMP domain-containing protein, partial [Methylobacterium sp. WL7]